MQTPAEIRDMIRDARRVEALATGGDTVSVATRLLARYVQALADEVARLKRDNAEALAACRLDLATREDELDAIRQQIGGGR